MVYGIYQSAAGLQVNQYRQSVLANNLANVQTAGFKPDLTLVRERPVESREDGAAPSLSHPVLDELTGGSLVAPTVTSFEQGPIEPTGRPLDLAIDGDGFFAVSDAGQERYTRDGRLMFTPTGELVTAAGNHAVLGTGGEPLRVPANLAGRVRIDADGRLAVGGTVYGQIRTVSFEDTSLLRKTGGNLIQGFGQAPETAQVRLRVGAVEGSAVDPTQTLVSLMQVSRAYEMNATLVGLADTTLGRAVNDLGRIR